jgi:hypothetical protein
MPQRTARQAPIDRCHTGEVPSSGVVCVQNNNASGHATLAASTDDLEEMFMQNSLSWIEWLDRLDRVLKGARQDVKALARFSSPHAVAAIERCTRQLRALTNDLQLLDRSVLSPKPGATNLDRADDLQKALDTTVFHLETVANSQAMAHSPPASASVRERMLAAVDSALRDSSYEAAMLLGPNRRRA